MQEKRKKDKKPHKNPQKQEQGIKQKHYDSETKRKQENKVCCLAQQTPPHCAPTDAPLPEDMFPAVSSVTAHLQTRGHHHVHAQHVGGMQSHRPRPLTQDCSFQ